MPQTLLAKKSGPQDNAIATDDDHHAAMTNDPSIHQFPQTSFNSFNYNQSTSGFMPGIQSTAVNNFGGLQQQQQSIQPNLTQAGSNAAQGADVLVENDNKDWINKKWRPMMGWMYMATCTADFVVFPILWSVLQALSKGNVTSQWQPLTLQGAGLYHVAMGAVLGIAAYGRTKEKIEGAAK